MAAPSFVNVGTYLTGTATSAAVAVPASTAAGRVVVVYLHLDGAATAVTMPSGFAEAEGSPVQLPSGSGSHSLHVMWKRLTGADSGTYTFSWSSSRFREAQAVQYQDVVASGTPFDSPTGTNSTTASVTASPAVSTTSLGADRLLLWSATNWSGGTWTAPSGFTKRVQGSFGVVTAADKSQPSAGGSGSVSGTCTGSDKQCAWIGALIGTTSGSADVTVSGSAGAVRVRPGSGAVRAVQVAPLPGSGGAVRLRGGQGAVLAVRAAPVAGSAGSVRLRASAGTVTPVRVAPNAGTAGSVRIRPGSGAVTAVRAAPMAGAAGAVRLRAGSGAVTAVANVTVAGAPGSIRLRTSAGQIISGVTTTINGSAASLRLVGGAGRILAVQHRIASGSAGRIVLRAGPGSVTLDSGGAAVVLAGASGVIRLRAGAGTVTGVAPEPVSGPGGVINVRERQTSGMGERPQLRSGIAGRERQAPGMGAHDLAGAGMTTRVRSGASMGGT